MGEQSPLLSSHSDRVPTRSQTWTTSYLPVPNTAIASCLTRTPPVYPHTPRKAPFLPKQETHQQNHSSQILPRFTPSARPLPPFSDRTSPIHLLQHNISLHHHLHQPSPSILNPQLSLFFHIYIPYLPYLSDLRSQ